MTDDEVIAVAKMFGASLEKYKTYTGKIRWRWVHMGKAKNSGYGSRSAAIYMARQYFQNQGEQNV